MLHSKRSPLGSTELFAWGWNAPLSELSALWLSDRRIEWLLVARLESLFRERYERDGYGAAAESMGGDTWRLWLPNARYGKFD
jgi:hypothetical protein